MEHGIEKNCHANGALITLETDSRTVLDLVAELHSKLRSNYEIK